ncbi:cytochrome c-type biogenesis protein CcmH [Undibacterium amnicola]|uniref:Cytochrome c-type biogenesis protein n=2 Tax=Undibacterium amnicola TaxID=1834038 RepID=A0ABR6XTC3_9BURK|nr:cytochrome c-type biogenesis protein CcmH [Undibacterium amnicola]
MKQLCALTCSLIIVASPVFAQQPSKLEQRVLSITEELRCLVCQNQSIADSHAELAVQLKSQVREQLKQGRSDTEVRDYMVQRYGDFVLYRPPVQSSTWLLWFGPALFLLIAASVLMNKFRQAQHRLRTESDEDTMNDSVSDLDINSEEQRS